MNICNDIAKQIIKDSTSEVRADRRKDKVFWPSDSSVVLTTPFGHRVEGTCLRKLFYEYTKASPTNICNPKYTLIQRAGKAWEVEILDILRKSEDLKVISTNEKFRYNVRNFTISGEFDVVIEKDGLIFGVDIKTTKGDYYDAKDVIRKGSGPKVSNILQMMLYLDYVKNERPEFANLWKILYFGRSDGEAGEYDISLSSEGYPIIDGQLEQSININSIYDRFELLCTYLDLGIEPDRDYSLQWSQQETERRFNEDSSFYPKFSYFKLSKTAMKKSDDGAIMGSAVCQLLCPFRDMCWPEL